MRGTGSRFVWVNEVGEVDEVDEVGEVRLYLEAGAIG